jgi:hypothetical protein
MGEMLDLQNELKRIESDINTRVMSIVREAQAMHKQSMDLYNEAARELMKAGGMVNKAVAMTIMPTIEEIHGEGGPAPVRPRRTRLEVPEEPSAAHPGAVGNPASKLGPGKRACSICHRPGHRKTTCPER